MNKVTILGLEKVEKGLSLMEEVLSCFGIYQDTNESETLLDILNGEGKENTTSECYGKTFGFSFDEEVSEFSSYIYTLFENNELKSEFKVDNNYKLTFEDQSAKLIKGLDICVEGLELLKNECEQDSSLKETLESSLKDGDDIYRSPFKRLSMPTFLENFKEFRNAYLKDIGTYKETLKKVV